MRDLAARGLLADTLVLWTKDFGRRSVEHVLINLDFRAASLRILGLDRERLTWYHKGLNRGDHGEAHACHPRGAQRLTWGFDEGRICYYRYFDPQRERDARCQRLRSGLGARETDAPHLGGDGALGPSLRRRVFQNGWRRDFDSDTHITAYVRSVQWRHADVQRVGRGSDYFLKEVQRGKQMNFEELDRYIAELNQRGFDTVQLRVQYHKKFSTPLFALIMALIGVPFAFRGGTRGAMAAVGLSFSIAIAYVAINQAFRADRESQSVASGAGGLGSRWAVCAGGIVLRRADAELRHARNKAFRRRRTTRRCDGRRPRSRFAMGRTAVP